MMLLLLARLLVVRCICFIEESSSIPRAVIANTLMTSLDSLDVCKFACLADTSCEAAKLSASSCILLGSPLSGGPCSQSYSSWRKTTSGCPQWNLTAGYIVDTCFRSSVLTPNYLRIDMPGICPAVPVEGEATTRLYMVSVIFANGSHGVFDNDQLSTIRWDPALGTYFYVYDNGVVRREEELFAATCAYRTSRDANCNCKQLPKDEATSSKPGANWFGPNPSPICAAGRVAEFIYENSGARGAISDVHNWNVYCRGGKWLLAPASLAGTVDAHALANGTCYIPG